MRVESSGDPSLNREAGSKLIFATTRSSAAAAVSSPVGEISHINLIYTSLERVLALARVVWIFILFRVDT